MHLRCAALALCAALSMGAGRVCAQGVLSNLGQLSLDGVSLDDPRMPMARRVAQARALGHWGDPQVAVSLLVEALSRRPSEPLRSAVIRALAERRSVQAVPELLRALRGRVGNPVWLIQALSVIGGTSVIEPITELAQRGERGLRDAALRVLVRTDPERAAPLMLEAGAGRDLAERQRALAIATEFPHRLWLSLVSNGLREAGTEHEAAGLAWALTRLPEGAGLPALLDAVSATGDVPMPLRVAIAVVLRAHAEHLTQDQRHAALRILQRGGTEPERDRLRRLAVGEDAAVEGEESAVDEGAARSSVSVAARLRQTLRLRGDDVVAQRMVAARRLGQLADPKAHVPLIAALDDPSPDLRRTAVIALARLDREEAVSALRRHLSVELDPEIAQITALALAADPIAFVDPWFRGRQLLLPPVDRQVTPLAR